MRIQQFNFEVDLLQCLIWMYDKATNLKSLVTQKQEWYDVNQSQFWQNWYNNVFNLLTADKFGLCVWSYILYVPLYLNFIPEPEDKPIWGFNEYTPSFPNLLNSYFNFGNGNFSTIGTELYLTEEEQRFLLRLRYFQLTTRGDVTDINWFLNYLIQTSDINYSGTLYMLDGLDMSITYVFSSPDFPTNLLQVLKDLDVLPRPAGVKIKYAINEGTAWGFGIYNQNFENGNFLRTITNTEV